jgi:hypothetical protein
LCGEEVEHSSCAKDFVRDSDLEREKKAKMRRGKRVEVMLKKEAGKEEEGKG